MRKIMSASVFLALMAAAAFSEEREQLPPGVKPERYDLALLPDAEKLTFSGKLRIQVAVSAPSSSIVLNEDDLTLDSAVLDRTRPARVSVDAKLQRAALAFDAPVAPGKHTLTIDYHGNIGKSTLGFFAMDYDSPQGQRRTLATNFEPASERRFMPSWDEPGDKAVFALTVDVPADRMAVSNMPAASTRPLGNGMKRVRFAPTPRMSTYLYFLGIGDFERIAAKSDGTEIGVVVNRGDTDKARYALGEAARILHYYNEYFGVRYPLPKLDLIVGPGQIAGGSMENWGAIFYSQNHLLFDPKLSTDADRRQVFLVVAHEMAHQWFGDLVTMKWWDNLWLNEGFARWMENKIAFDLHPEWETNMRALLIAEYGKEADAKPSTHPIVQKVLTAAQAEQAFDDITYAKGAAVIRMLEAYAGPDNFRAGVRRYMKAHAYGNTEDADFWKEVQAVSGKPILGVEADFTTQTGVPLLKVDEKDGLGLSEGRFAEDPSTVASLPPQRWRIPVAVRAGAETKTYLLDGANPVNAVEPAAGPVVVNAGQYGYFRTLYPKALMTRFSAQPAALGPADQLGVLYDAWALGVSGYEPVTDFLDLARSMPVDADPAVWQRIVAMLEEIDALYPESNRAAFETFAGKELRPLADRLGPDPKPGEDPNLTNLRNSILTALSRFGDQSVIGEARRRFEAAMDHPESMSPETRRTVIAIVARHADGPAMDRLMTAVRGSDPLERQKLLGAMAQVSDPSQAERVVRIGTGAEAPAGSAPYTLLALAANHPDLIWKMGLEYVSRPDAAIDSMLKLRLMPEIASNSADLSRIDDLEAYAAKNIPPEARKAVESAISSIRLNAKFRAERLPQIDRWLRGPAAN
jgi:aminopeptidase N